MIKTDLERFQSRVDKSVLWTDCWIWMGRKNQFGYGLFRMTPGRHESAHRAAIRFATGSAVPRNLQVDHKCHTTLCVNPDHLQVVTQSLNQQNRRGASKHNSCGVRGVSWDKSRGKWAARVQKDGKYHYAGRFDTLEEADRAAKEMRNRLFTNNLVDRRTPDE